jgi:Alpha/beta hydrolase family
MSQARGGHVGIPAMTGKLLILFVHGLGGGAGTWGSFQRLLNADDALKGRIAIAEFTFPTRLVRWLPWVWKSAPLQDLAKGLETEIRAKYSTHSKILLVCHSLGGLIAKRVIVEAVKIGSVPPIREVMFFATPHLGADIASWADRISHKHRHLKQLRKDSDFIELVNEDWSTFKCEGYVGTTYVAGGQDAVVSRQSARAGQSVRLEFIPDKGHIDIVKPANHLDTSFLLVKQVAQRLLVDWGDDLADLRVAVEQRDSTKAQNLIIARGRSWIETEDAPDAIKLLEQVEQIFDRDSIEVVWSQYLRSIARLFRERLAPPEAFNESFLDRARRYGLEALVLAERMEFARKRNDPSALEIARDLEKRIAPITVATSQNNAYALGVANFLLGNLLRAGGLYAEATKAIERARSFYRAPILSHQVELAHCHYALAICRAMTHGRLIDEFPPIALGAQFRRFANALGMLAHSHSEWARNQLGEAIEQVENAALIFKQIRFVAYGKKAETLASLLQAWRRLELGLSLDQVSAHVGDQDIVLRALVGNSTEYPRLKDWIRSTRPSRVLGMLQYASAFNANWTEDMGSFDLPPLLFREGAGLLTWKIVRCNSLAEAYTTLRSLMGITHDARLPLIAD